MKSRISIVALLAAALTFAPVGTLRAGTTGTISGTVTESATHVGLSGVTVAAISPSASYTTHTDAKGFFAMAGVAPDTYTISFELHGYQAQTIVGVNVFADQSAVAGVALDKSLVTIGRVTARSAGGAFQPTQTQDTYTVTASQIQTDLGKSYSLSETALLGTLPGVTLDVNGYPVLRGGRENEEGFEFEGIDYTDAFTHQFVNSLALNNPGSLQFTPGSGDASSGNNGTGSINLLSKRGTYPAFGSADLEMVAEQYGHRFGFEYGFATPNGRISNYITFTGSNDYLTFGARGAPAASLSNGTFFTTRNETDRDLIDNFYYKFGPGNNQSLQFLYQTQSLAFVRNYGGIDNLNFKTGDPFTLFELSAISGLSAAQVQSIIGFAKGQTAVQQALNRYSTNYQPNATLKFQYSINPDPSTYVTAKFYKVNAVTTFDFPFADNNLNFSGTTSLQGGLRTGFAVDATKQLNSQNLIKLGGKFEYLQPIFDYLDNLDGFLALAGEGSGYDVASYLPNNSSCPLGPYCGYLLKYFPTGLQTPDFNAGNYVTRQDFSLYLDDAYSPSDRLKIEGGLRMDSANYRYPAFNSGLFLPASFDSSGNPVYAPIPSQAKNPFVYEPRLAFTYRLSRDDSFRAAFGRSVNMPPIAFINSYTPPSYYSKYANVPSYDALGAFFAGATPGTPFPAMWCGITQNQQCKTFADQLYWNYQINFNGIPMEPAVPETFTNYEASYSHQFPGNVAVKVTPYYRRGYDALVLVASPKIVNGQILLDANGNPVENPAVTLNNGIERTTGVEFLLTKEAAFGLSGSLSATYINELSNVIPLTAGEDFFPSIPPASLALGNLYRVGFISPFQATAALQYRFHNGFRINPIVSYNKGYPLGQGLLTAVFLGRTPANVPNTNVSDPNGATGAPQYVDPLNPGTITRPNVAAVRGTPESSSAGGFLSSARFNTNLDFEYSTPGSHNTVGFLISNLFNQLYNLPGYNLRYQPVANGVAGPKTGQSSLPLLFPGVGFGQYGSNRFGYDPYLINPNEQPLAIRMYFQVAL